MGIMPRPIGEGRLRGGPPPPGLTCREHEWIDTRPLGHISNVPSDTLKFGVGETGIEYLGIGAAPPKSLQNVCFHTVSGSAAFGHVSYTT